MRTNQVVTAGVVVLLVAGCPASEVPIAKPTAASSSSTSGSGGQGGDDEGGDVGGGQPSADGGADAGEGGAGGDGFGDEPTADGVDRVAALDYVATELACGGGTLFWFNEPARLVMRLSGNAETDAFAVEGDGKVTIRPAGSAVMVSRHGADGAIWLVDSSGSERVHEGRIEYAAFGDGQPHWYDGASILNPAGVTAEPESEVVAFALYDEGPVYLTDDNLVFMTKRGTATRVGSVLADYYPDTFTTVGAVAAWGSRSGLRTLLLSGTSLYTFGTNVQAVAVGETGLYACDVTGNGASVGHLELTGKLSQIATHASCVSISECAGHVYWSTSRGNILRVKSVTR